MKQRSLLYILLFLIIIGTSFILSGCDGQISEDDLSSFIQTALNDILNDGEETTDMDTEATTENEEVQDENERFSGDMRFYYGQLSAEEQDAYDTIYDGIQKFEQEIDLNLSDEEAIHRVYRAVLNDHPEIFWCDNSYQFSRRQLIFTTYSLLPQYLFSQEEMEAKQEQIEEAVQDSLSGISADASDYQKILYVYRYLIEQTDYDVAAVRENRVGEDQNIDSVFLNRTSVCAGYARATQYLLNELDVFCTYVEGTATERGDAHTWNIVQCDGDYYHVDTTWGDPVFSGEVPDTIPESARINYNYLCCNDEQIFRTHTLDTEYGFSFPECNSLDWNYYVVNDQYYDHYDSDEIWSEIENDIARQQTVSVFKFSDETVYQQARDQIIDEYTRDGMTLIQRLYRRGTISCYHSDNEDETLIQIFWQY